MTLTTAKWTLEEYHRLRDVEILSDRRVELLRGDIVEKVLEKEPHVYSRGGRIFNGVAGRSR